MQLLAAGPCGRDLLAMRDVRRRERSGYGAARTRMARGSQHSSGYQYESVQDSLFAMRVFLYLRSLSSRALRIYTCVTSVIHTRNSWCYPWDAVQTTLREKATSLATKVTCVRACTTPSLMDNSVVVSDMPPLVDNVDFAVGLARLALGDLQIFIFHFHW